MDVSAPFLPNQTYPITGVVPVFTQLPMLFNDVITLCDLDHFGKTFRRKNDGLKCAIKASVTHSAVFIQLIDPAGIGEVELTNPLVALGALQDTIRAFPARLNITRSR